MEYLRAGQAIALLQGGAILIRNYRETFIVVDGEKRYVRRNVFDKLGGSGRIMMVPDQVVCGFTKWQWAQPAIKKAEKGE